MVGHALLEGWGSGVWLELRGSVVGVGGVRDGRPKGEVAHGDSAWCGPGWERLATAEVGVEWVLGGGEGMEGSPTGSEQAGTRPSRKRDRALGAEAQAREGGVVIRRRRQGDGQSHGMRCRGGWTVCLT